MIIKEGETNNVWIQFETGYRLDKRKAGNFKSYGNPYHKIRETEKSAKLVIRRAEKETEEEMVLKNEGRE